MSERIGSAPDGGLFYSPFLMDPQQLHERDELFSGPAGGERTIS